MIPEESRDIASSFERPEEYTGTILVVDDENSFHSHQQFLGEPR